MVKNMVMQQENQTSIAEWAEEAFGPVSDYSALVKRASLELIELEQAVYDGSKDEIANEIADVMILLYRLAELNKIDLAAAINKKMTINRKRRWLKSGDGTGRHV
jgi:NTP pyrophosphatase (non-canonical NTP hydrolase)